MKTSFSFDDIYLNLAESHNFPEIYPWNHRSI